MKSKHISGLYQRFCIIVILCLHAVFSYSQVNPGDTLNVSFTGINAGFHFPAADLGKRFGYNGSLGVDYTHLLKNRWIYQFSGDFIFGDQIKNETGVLSNIATEDGFVIDREGTLQKINIYERGFTLYASAGKLFPAFNYNPNTGIVVLAGLGYMQHQYRFEIENNNTPQLDGDYVKGYDHRCGGPSLRQFVGYFHLGNTRKINYYVGLDIKEAFTFSMRPYYFNEMKVADEKRFDMMAGIKFGWILPLYKKTQSTFYYE